MNKIKQNVVCRLFLLKIWAIEIYQVVKSSVLLMLYDMQMLLCGRHVDPLLKKNAYGMQAVVIP